MPNHTSPWGYQTVPRIGKRIRKAPNYERDTALACSPGKKRILTQRLQRKLFTLFVWTELYLSENLGGQYDQGTKTSTASRGSRAWWPVPVAPKVSSKSYSFWAILRQEPYFVQILGSAPPFGLNLRWASLTKILNPRLDCGGTKQAFMALILRFQTKYTDPNCGMLLTQTLFQIWSDSNQSLGPE